MNFGKNRVQYAQSDVLKSDFYYSFLRFDRYDVYFYPNGQELAEYLSQRVETELAQLENFLEFTLTKRVIFLVFNRLTDFRQSNIGLISGRDETSVGGVTKIVDNKVFVYFDGNYKHFDQQIRSAMAEVILQEMLFGGSMRERVTSSTLLNLPTWYYQGLLSYISKGWDIVTDERVRDGITTGKFEKFNHLTGDDAIYAGHSIWNFIAETFGRSVIPNIVYFTKVNKNVASGFLNVLGLSLNALTYEWKYYYEDRYSDPSYQGTPPEGADVKLKRRKSLVYLKARMSPDGRYVAYTSNQLGRLKVMLYDEQTGKSKTIFRFGAKLGQIEDYSFPVLAWHPSGNLLAMTTEYKGIIRFSKYLLETRKWEHEELKDFEKVLDLSYSDDGLNLAISGVIKGQSDIFIHNLVAHTNQRITNDRADDRNPRFINHSRDIVFVSDRASTSLSEQKDQDETTENLGMFVYHLDGDHDHLTQLASDAYASRYQPDYIPGNGYSYLGDDNGIINRFTASYDSTIVAIDTTIHYGYFTRSKPITNYNTSILDQSISRGIGNLTELFFSNDRYHLKLGTLPDKSFSISLKDTPAKMDLVKSKARKDSLEQLRQSQLEDFQEFSQRVYELGSDSVGGANHELDINNYLFEAEKNIGNSQKNQITSWLSRLRNPLGQETSKLPQVRIYQPSFYVNYLASQVDFSFLNEFYQPFTGAGVSFYNPGLNMMFKVGTQDLFEDYKLTAGVRLGYDFNSNEYLVSFENLKYRLDQEFLFHRMVYQTNTVDYSSLLKASSQEFLYMLKYPFSQVSSIRSSLSLRIDDYTFLSTDQQNLKEKGISKYWGGLKLEYVFDNTLNTAINLYDGTRLKLFGEYYQQVNDDYSDVFIVGADVRHYQPLHRTLTLATRFAASTSFGGGRLLYYLGGVDQWVSLNPDKPIFDSSVPIDTTQYFVYQALATNMRGFSQNIRNGNSFAVLNTEIRWPVFRYFSNGPISSDFLSNFQIIGFFDVGTAWSGPTPWDERNHLNREVIEKGPIKVVIHKGNEPFVSGFGFGLRSRLLGYFIRADWAWGIENYVLLPRIFYLSLSLDF